MLTKQFSRKKLTIAAYRPFCKEYYYADLALSDLLTKLHFQVFGETLSNNNLVINYTGPRSGKPFLTLMTNHVPDLHFVSAGAATQCLPLYSNHQLGITSLKAHAREAGVVNKRFLEQLMNSDFGWNVQDDLREGLTLGVREAPALFINGKFIEKPLNSSRVSKAIQQELKTNKNSLAEVKRAA